MNYDPIPLMNQLARMAGIPEGRFRKMVLVLDVCGDAPVLYTEGYLEKTDEELVPTPLIVKDGAPPVNLRTSLGI